MIALVLKNIYEGYGVMEESIDIRFKYTEKEYADAIRWYYLKASRIRFDFIVGILLTLIGSMLWFTDQKNIIYIVLIVAGVLFLGILIFAININPAKTFRNEPKFRDEYFLNFSSEGIVFKTKHISSTLEWNHYIRFNESEKVYYLVYGQFMLTIIPKSAFKTKKDEEEFKRILMIKLKAECKARQYLL
jgi:hypothetical protein